MNISRLNGWTASQIMWETSYRSLMELLATVKASNDKAQDGTDSGSNDYDCNAKMTPDSFQKLRSLGINVQDMS